MKLITETNMSVEYEVIDEEKSGKKSYYVEGPFLQGAVQNHNGRVYPTKLLQNEVNRYCENFIKENRALGELGHPEGPIVNMHRVSHKIISLKQLQTESKSNGSLFIGKAKILDTPYGQIVKNLIDEGVKLGVSSRGMGSVKEIDGVQEVQSDFKLATVDIVSDPSAPAAFVNGIMEGKEWIWNNGIIEELKINSIKNDIEKASSNNLEEAKLKAWSDFILGLTR